MKKGHYRDCGMYNLKGCQRGLLRNLQLSTGTNAKHLPCIPSEPESTTAPLWASASSIIHVHSGAWVRLKS